MAQPKLPLPVAEAFERADVTALLALGDQDDRELRKAAKRALHLLRAKGVTVPERASPPLTPAVEPSGDEPREAVRLTTFDGAGERAFFVPLKAPQGYTLYIGITSDTHELKELTSQAMSRRQLKGYFASLPAETHDVLRELSLAEGALLIRPSLLHVEGPLGPLARILLAALPEGATVERAPGTANPDLLAETVELFRSPAFASYVPDRASIDKLSAALAQVVESPLYVDETQRLAQLRHVVEEATIAFFDPPRRKRYALRATEAAELFLSQDKALDAERALALAEALRGDGEVMSIPFARVFFERLLNLEAALKLGPPPSVPAQTPARSGLIVPPG